ncbi:uncharacterized protein RSE6_07491 [Rhynchosporium secalis]|uniref:Uncharacterized protein n=1 Tax=Rhynchosporium secalis TaxID=38038 RepID=A0A1E1MCY8_RHYSE|nr:uncharacterized protein RSE6_07491 [Rhynchosporium secalis]
MRNTWPYVPSNNIILLYLNLDLLLSADCTRHIIRARANSDCGSHDNLRIHKGQGRKNLRLTIEEVKATPRTFHPEYFRNQNNELPLEFYLLILGPGPLINADAETTTLKTPQRSCSQVPVPVPNYHLPSVYSSSSLSTSVFLAKKSMCDIHRIIYDDWQCQSNDHGGLDHGY